MEYRKIQPIKLKEVGKDEKWLQDQINKDTSILGLGDLVVIQRERTQAMGGRLDFLMFDPEDNTRYEIEIMLGTLNESHIIRTIEYWDIERRRYPTLEHRAVIVAEDITNRFFNIISLMNKSIPIIAIQLNVFTYENYLFLNFVKVLDLADIGEDEIESEPDVNREYWISRASPVSISLMDSIIDIVRKISEPRVTYNKKHVAIGTTDRNFIWLYPRKGQHLRLRLRIGEDRENTFIKFEQQGIVCSKGKHPEMMRMAVTEKEMQENGALIREAITSAETQSH